MDRYSDNTAPETLENMLASDSEAFCTIIQKCYRSKKEDQKLTERSAEDRSFAENARHLLYGWKTPPGTQKDGTFNEEHFNKWLQNVKQLCTESGHLEVALGRIGQVLIHAPADPDGLWIHHAVAAELNDSSAEEMRDGFWSGIVNSRGLYRVDPSGKPEKELAEQYRKKAEEMENAGFYRFAVTLRSLSDYYSKEAERVIAKYKSRNE